MQILAIGKVALSVGFLYIAIRIPPYGFKAAAAAVALFLIVSTTQGYMSEQANKSFGKWIGILAVIALLYLAISLMRIFGDLS